MCLSLCSAVQQCFHYSLAFIWNNYIVHNSKCFSRTQEASSWASQQRWKVFVFFCCCLFTCLYFWKCYCECYYHDIVLPLCRLTIRKIYKIQIYNMLKNNVEKNEQKYKIVLFRFIIFFILVAWNVFLVYGFGVTRTTNYKQWKYLLRDVVILCECSHSLKKSFSIYFYTFYTRVRTNRNNCLISQLTKRFLIC